MTHDEMLRAGVTLVRAMMRSASTDKIRPIEWWTRAQTALVAAAESSSTFSALVSRMGKALQIERLSTESSGDVVWLADDVAADFDAFVRFCSEEALYIVALAQAERKQEREASPRWRDRSDGPPKSAPAPFDPPTTTTTESAVEKELF